MLAGLAVLLAAGSVQAQNPETTPRERLVQDARFEPGPLPMSKFGTRLSNAEVRALLGEMQQLAQQALAASRAAEQASSVAEVKAGADRVLEVVWGVPSRYAAGEGADEIRTHGWKERWQVTGGEFDPNFAKRYGTEPPRITDPRKLGLMGRGRAVRGRLEQISGGSVKSPVAQRTAAGQVVHSLNNVIGWTYVTTGFKGKEVQPRISLTYVWDAPSEFWQSSADTGWLEEVYAQGANILKTDYAGDTAEARRHAAEMTALLQKVLDGVDADRNGTIEPKMMEGGLNEALRAAGRAVGE